MSESSTLSEHDVKPAANKPSRTTRTLFLRILIFILFICFYIISTATRHFHTSQDGKRTHKNMYVTIKRPKSREYFLFYTKNNHTFCLKASFLSNILSIFLYYSISYTNFTPQTFALVETCHNIIYHKNIARQLSAISLKDPKRILFT